MLLDAAGYERFFAGFTVVDCSVRTRDVLYLVAVEDYDRDEPPPPDTDRKTRVIACFLREPPEERWAYAAFTGFNRLLAGAAQRPKEQFVGVDAEGFGVSLGGGPRMHEPQIPGGREGPRRGGVRKTRTVGEHLYACTGYRGLGKREAPGKWVSLVKDLDFEPDPEVESDEYGFDDFDAFAPDDLYAVGGKGDVWRFDGKAWEHLDFPSNMFLEAMCCAGDGAVYIGGQNGSVWKGRGDEWRQIHRGNMVLPFKDMVWFGDRVYCTSDYGLWEIVGDRLNKADVLPDIEICSGNLWVADGVMLLAGARGAALFDGNDWQLLYETLSLTAGRQQP